MMLEKLQKIEERLREVERQLADPAVYTDQQKLARLMREQKELAPVVSVYHALLRAQQAQEATGPGADVDAGVRVAQVRELAHHARRIGIALRDDRERPHDFHGAPHLSRHLGARDVGVPPHGRREAHGLDDRVR